MRKEHLLKKFLANVQNTKTKTSKTVIVTALSGLIMICLKILEIAGTTTEKIGIILLVGSFLIIAMAEGIYGKLGEEDQSQEQSK